MAKITGVTLEQCWSGLAQDAKSSIARQLDGFIQQWRQVEGPFFGPGDGGACADALFQHSWDATSRLYGPFSTRKEFNQGW